MAEMVRMMVMSREGRREAELTLRRRGVGGRARVPGLGGRGGGGVDSRRLLRRRTRLARPHGAVSRRREWQHCHTEHERGDGQA